MERRLQTQRYPAANLHIELRSVSKLGVPSEVMDVVVSTKGRVLIRHHRIADGSVESRNWHANRRGEPRPAKGQGVAQPPPNEPPAWVRWLSGQSATALFRTLGIDRSVSSLALSERTVLWVAGAKPRQFGRAQVHLERETGRLRRVVELRGPVVLDTLFKGTFQSDDDALRWPRFITFQTSGKVTTFEVVRVVQNAVFDEDSDVHVEIPPPEKAGNEKARKVIGPGEAGEGSPPGESK